MLYDRKLDVHTAAAAVMRAVQLQLLGPAKPLPHRSIGFGVSHK